MWDSCTLSDHQKSHDQSNMHHQNSEWLLDFRVGVVTFNPSQDKEAYHQGQSVVSGRQSKMIRFHKKYVHSLFSNFFWKTFIPLFVLCSVSAFRDRPRSQTSKSFTAHAPFSQWKWMNEWTSKNFKDEQALLLQVIWISDFVINISTLKEVKKTFTSNTSPIIKNTEDYAIVVYRNTIVHHAESWSWISMSIYIRNVWL